MWISAPELENLMGRDATQVLMKHHGGRQFYVLARPDASNFIAALVGPAAYRALSQHFAGQRITVPNGRIEPQKGAIIKLLEQGLSYSAIAARCQVTERYVYHIARTFQTRQRQLTLPL